MRRVNAVACAPDPGPAHSLPVRSDSELSDYDYELPPELIATQPALARDGSRLLLVGRDESGLSRQTDAGFEHRCFAELPELISRQVGEQTLLVLNDSKVFPARLHGNKLRPDDSLGGQIEFLLTDPLPQTELGSVRWRALYRCSKPLRPGHVVRLQRPGQPGHGTHDVQVQTAGQGVATLDFGRLSESELSSLLSRIGEVPLPPYIESARLRDGQPRAIESDRGRYQTVFARDEGSVAAPTAGLHFTEELLTRLRAFGHEIAYVTLHVGPGTFLPLRSDRIDEHVMHSERYQISAATAEAINAAKAAGRRVLAVGTTVVRTLEAAAQGRRSDEPLIRPCAAGETQIFIYPPYRFAVVDALLTNFHLPRSTLLMLVAAFAGRECILSAYARAVAERYRFYSFGDAMLIPRAWAAVP